jgi:aminopeptidase N
LQRAIDENPVLEIDINEIYESWALQPGYPIVHVSREITQRNVVLRLSQEQYWSKDTEPKTNRLWWIPFNVATSKIPDFQTTTPDGWLSTIAGTFTLDRTDDNWVILNKQQTGYYRVNYDSDLWQLIGDQLKRDATIIHPGNRGQLVDDAFNLARSGHIDYDVVLELIEFLNEEIDYLPWSPANIGLKYMKQMLTSSVHFEEFQIFVGNLIENLYEKVGFDDPSDDWYFSKFVRNIAIDWACQLNVSDCVEQSLKAMSEHLTSTAELSPDTKATVYCIGVRHSELAFDGLWTKFQTSEDQYERSLIISSLGCSLSTSKIDEFLLKSINDDPDIRHQEKSRILTAVIGNDELGVDKAIEFIAVNHVTIRAKCVSCQVYAKSD